MNLCLDQLMTVSVFFFKTYHCKELTALQADKHTLGKAVVSGIIIHTSSHFSPHRSISNHHTMDELIKCVTKYGNGTFQVNDVPYAIVIIMCLADKCRRSSFAI